MTLFGGLGGSYLVITEMSLPGTPFLVCQEGVHGRSACCIPQSGFPSVLGEVRGREKTYRAFREGWLLCPGKLDFTEDSLGNGEPGGTASEMDQDQDRSPCKVWLLTGWAHLSGDDRGCALH